MRKEFRSRDAVKDYVIDVVKNVFEDFTGSNNFSNNVRLNFHVFRYYDLVHLKKYAYHLDSLDEIEILMSIEEELEIELDDDSMANTISLEEFINFITDTYIERFPLVEPVTGGYTVGSQIVDELADVIKFNTLTNPNLNDNPNLRQVSGDSNEWEVKNKRPIIEQPNTISLHKDNTILVLPSLIEHGKYSVTYGLSEEEITDWFLSFELKVDELRKCKYEDDLDEDSLPYEMYHFDDMDADSLDPDDVEEFIKVCGISTIPSKRGTRAAFLDLDNKNIYIGTTVVYNSNRAMIGVTDTSVYKKLSNIISYTSSLN